MLIVDKIYETMTEVMSFVPGMDKRESGQS